MEFLVSDRDKFSLVAISYEEGYSSLYETERLFIRLKEYSPFFNGNLIRLYDISIEERQQMIADIENCGHLKLEKYYPGDDHLLK